MSGILTQDKKTFVNAYSVALISMQHHVYENLYKITAHEVYDDLSGYVVLGKYGTYERAIDIHEKLCTAIFNNNENMYLMPEK